MKKSLLSLLALSLLTISTLSAQSLMKSLNSLSKSENTTIDLPEGKELLPYVFEYVDNCNSQDNSICKIEKYDMANNKFTLSKSIIFKFGIGLQKQDSTVEISAADGKITINTTKMTTVSCDKNGKATGTATENANSSLTKQNTMIADEFAKCSDEVYESYLELSYTNLQVLYECINKAPNTVKAKQWVKNHPLEEKKINCSFTVFEIDLSDKDEYAYKVSGMFVPQGSIDPIMIYVYSNNDSYADLKENSGLTVTGTIHKAGFKELIGYELSSIVIYE